MLVSAFAKSGSRPKAASLLIQLVGQLLEEGGGVGLALT